MLSVEAIKAAKDIRVERVDIPEWGGHVFVRMLPAEERDAWETEITIRRGSDIQMDTRNVRARFAVRVVCDQDGKPLFGPDDAGLLGGKSAAALDRIFEAGSKLNRFSKQDADALVKP